tara:strand:- start:442 stop:687 length:246 start_codon:yes stop_codon:yes gene_type:complete
MKTVISANIPVELAIRLKDKTKGTRSRVISRALKAYLDERDAFTLSDIPTRQLMAALHSRDDTPKHVKIILYDQLMGEGLL